MARMPLKFAFMAAGMALLLAAMRGVMPAVWSVGWEELNPEALLSLALCYQLGVGVAIALMVRRVPRRPAQQMAVVLAAGIVALTLLEVAVPVSWIMMQTLVVPLALGLIGVLVGMRQWRVFWLGLAELHAALVVVAAWRWLG